ncbi:MAG: integrase, partial [Acidobacteriota bacterium]|nr:integrase [Acidobacteriota bacterium]
MKPQTALAVKKVGRNRIASVPTERNPALIYLASLSATGRRSMRVLLEKVARLAGHDLDAAWSGMRFEHVAAFRSRLVEEGHAPATVNATLSALRGVARAAWHLGQITGEDYQRIAAVKGVRGERLP